MPSRGIEEFAGSDGTAVMGGQMAVAAPSRIGLGWWRQLSQVDWNVVATIGARLGVVAAGIVSSVMTARFLQPAGRGEYFLAVTVAQMIAQFANLGLPSSNTYFVAGNRSMFTGLFANSLWISFAGVPVVGVALMLLNARFGWMGVSHATLWFGVVLAPLILFNLLGSNLFVGLNELRTFNAVQVISALIVLPFMLLAGKFHSGSTGFLTASILGWSVTATLVAVLLRHHASGPLRFRPEIFKTTFSYSTRAYLTTLAGFLVLRINVFTLNAMAGSEQVGYYSIASQLADTVAILPQSIALVLFPLLVSRPEGRGRATVENAVRTAVILGAACLVLWFVAPPAVALAFGQRFQPAVPVIRAMLPGMLLVGVTAIVSQYLAAGGMPVSVVATWASGVVLTAVLGRELVRRFGAVGAGATLSVTYGVMLVVLTILAVRMARRTSPAA
jgi:O-antigen/teichoic acid export membrane protein